MQVAKPRNLTRRLFAATAAGVLLYVLLAIWAGWHDRQTGVFEFPLVYIPPILGLSCLNYALRYRRWNLLLRQLDISLSPPESRALFFSAFLMVVTPGKLGEAFKAGALWERHGTPLAKGLAVVLAERLYDFLAVLLLASLGLFFWGGPRAGVLTALFLAAVMVVGLLALVSRRLRLLLVRAAGRAPYFHRHRVQLEAALAAFSHLLQRRAPVSLLLSLAAWAAEGMGLWLVCVAYGADLAVSEALFVYAAGTIVGSLTFLPGGLVGTEGTLIGLLGALAVSYPLAVAIAVVVRLATLWLAVLVGVIVYVTVGRRYLRLSATASDAVKAEAGSSADAVPAHDRRPAS
jgi:uncharacterized protein (TIRG00374 family)